MLRIGRHAREIGADLLALPVQTLADGEGDPFVERLICAHRVRNQPRQKPQLRVAGDWRRTVCDDILSGQQQLVGNLRGAEAAVAWRVVALGDHLDALHALPEVTGCLRGQLLTI